jgi:YebC/PmpR family DNA-binding regulatory protein
MSGHSKWSTIKRQKGITDAKRGQLFTKLSKAITIAIKQNGNISDPAFNFRLRLAIDAAKASNMPKDNIERAIAKAAGSTDEVMQDVVYEGFGPGGFSVIVEAVTDNKLRTNSEIRNLFEKNGGTFAVPGAVSYQFVQKGMIAISKIGKTVDEIFLLAADSGAEDVEDAGEEAIIYTKPEELAKVREKLHGQGIVIQDAKLMRKAIVTSGITDLEIAKKALSFSSMLEDHDDAQEVFTNFDIPDEILTQIS